MVSVIELGFAASQALSGVCLAESCQAEVCLSNKSITMVIKLFSLLNALSSEMSKHFAQIECFSLYQGEGMDYYPSGSKIRTGIRVRKWFGHADDKK